MGALCGGMIMVVVVVVEDCFGMFFGIKLVVDCCESAPSLVSKFINDDEKEEEEAVVATVWTSSFGYYF